MAQNKNKTGKAVSNTLHHMKWPSFDNVHKAVTLLSHKGNFPLDQDVLALEKLDGSNLGLEIHVESGKLVGMFGRKTTLWHQEQQEVVNDPFNRHYGETAADCTLHPVLDYVPKLAKLSKALAKKSTAEDAAPCSIVFYGEWYQADKGGEPARWYPFGYRLRDHHHHVQTMTLDLYQDFLDHDLTPPKLLFQGGNFWQAVDALFDKMLAPTSARFEGVFITRATTPAAGLLTTQITDFGAKWKTGLYEEQAKFWIDTASVPTNLKPTVDKLEKVYETKKSREMSSKPKPLTELKDAHNREELESQAALAFASVMSKSAVSAVDIRSMTVRAHRGQMVGRLVAETVRELQEQYEGVSDAPCKKVLILVASGLVNRMIFSPPPAATP